MRWDALFDDLETQMAASERLDLDAEIAERTRSESAAVELADRLRGSLALPPPAAPDTLDRILGMTRTALQGAVFYCAQAKKNRRPELTVFTGPWRA